MTRMIQAATIRTYRQFSLATGRAMGEALVKKLGQVPDACWLFCAPLHGLDDLLKGICEAACTNQIIGCTTSGEISSDGQSINSAVLGGIVSDCIEFEFIRVQGLAEDSGAAGRKLAKSFSAVPRYLQIFSDGLTGNGCALLKGIADSFHTVVPVTGGAAGDNGDFRKTFQFDRGRIYSDAVCGIAFYGDFQLGTAVAQRLGAHRLIQASDQGPGKGRL